MRRRPRIWLASAAVASAWAALYTVVQWVSLYVSAPIHDDVRLCYVAAQAGLRYGWSTIYDEATLRALSSGFPESTRFIDAKTTFASTPFLAWAFAPLTAFPEPAAYAIWVAISVGALVVAWRLTAPYAGLEKTTLLLLALGLWPVLLTLYFGQPTLIVAAAVAFGWWLCKREQPAYAGFALAVATALKPQAVLLVPVALLLAGRFRVVAVWAGTMAFLVVVAALSLGSSGLVGWWHAVKGIQELSVNTMFTLAGPLGSGPLTYALWLVEGAAALWIAWARRHELELVFAAGILGTVATATYFHNSDYCILVIAAWFVLRTSPPMWHRLWLATGIVPMQLLLTPLNAAPQLAWDAAWIAILAIQALPALNAKAVPAEVVVTARGADQAAGRIGL